MAWYRNSQNPFPYRRIKLKGLLENLHKLFLPTMPNEPKKSKDGDGKGEGELKVHLEDGTLVEKAPSLEELEKAGKFEEDNNISSNYSIPGANYYNEQFFEAILMVIIIFYLLRWLFGFRNYV